MNSYPATTAFPPAGPVWRWIPPGYPRAALRAVAAHKAPPHAAAIARSFARRSSAMDCGGMQPYLHRSPTPLPSRTLWVTSGQVPTRKAAKPQRFGEEMGLPTRAATVRTLLGKGGFGYQVGVWRGQTLAWGRRAACAPRDHTGFPTESSSTKGLLHFHNGSGTIMQHLHDGTVATRLSRQKQPMYPQLLPLPATVLLVIFLQKAEKCPMCRHNPTHSRACPP